MKKYLVAGMFLILAGVVVAGCTTGGTGGSNAIITPAPSTGGVQETTVAVTATQPLLTFGDHYLQKSYSFHDTNDNYTEQVRIANQSWALVYKVTPLSDNPQTGWFEMTITNVDSKKSQTFGYGRTYAYDTYQQYPMYGQGSFEITMKGNLTKIDLDIATRLP
jgi:hypothetical protein